MELLSLEITAFKQFAEPVTISLADQGLVIVEGLNGSGKSLLLEAILWCLYEKLPRYGDRAVTTEVLHPTRGASVTVRARLHGRVHTFRRERPLRGRSSFTMTPDLPVSRDPSRRQDDIAALLGITYAAARYALLLQGRSSFAQVGFAGQMEVLESILRLDELREASELARAKATESDRALRQERAVADAASQSLDSLRAGVRDLEAAQSHDAEIAQLRDALTAAQAGASAHAGLLKMIQSAEVSVAQLQTHRATTNERVTSLTMQYQSLQRDRDKKICPTCQRPMEGAKGTDALLKKEQALHADLLTAQGAYTEATKEHARQMFALQQLQGQATPVAGSAELAASVTQRIRALEEQARSLAGLLAAARARVAEAEEVLETALKRRDVAEADFGLNQFWAQAYSRDGLQAVLFSQAVPVLNAAAASMARECTHGRIAVEFDPVRGVKAGSRAEDLVRIRGTSAPTFDGLSGGERQWVNLITMWALRCLAAWRAPTPFNFMACDEVFDVLDAEALGRAARWVSRLAQAPGATVMVVTHSTELKTLFRQLGPTRVLHVARGDQGESYVSG